MNKDSAQKLYAIINNSEFLSLFKEYLKFEQDKVHSTAHRINGTQELGAYQGRLYQIEQLAKLNITLKDLLERK